MFEKIGPRAVDDIDLARRYPRKTVPGTRHRCRRPRRSSCRLPRKPCHLSPGLLRRGRHARCLCRRDRTSMGTHCDRCPQDTRTLMSSADATVAHASHNTTAHARKTIVPDTRCFGFDMAFLVRLYMGRSRGPGLFQRSNSQKRVVPILPHVDGCIQHDDCRLARFAHCSRRARRKLGYAFTSATDRWIHETRH